MIEELLVQLKRKLPSEKKTTLTSAAAGNIAHNMFSPKIMDRPELSLGPSLSSFPDSSTCNSSSSSESEANYNHRKRKLSASSSWLQPTGTQTSIDLHLNNPLPLDWEQCLDLQSGRMYYLNRKSLKKSWVKPKEQKLDLDLNLSNSENNKASSTNYLTSDQDCTNTIMKQSSCSIHVGGGSPAMVAIACLNCHLLVMLYRSSPSCPNCKYMHLLLPSPPPPNKLSTTKPLQTLSLLH